MASKLAWRAAAVLGSLAVLGYAVSLLIKTTPFDTAGQAQMQGMPGMEHEPEAPGMQGTEPEAEMEHEAAEMGGHDMSPVDVSEAPAAGPNARGGQLLEPTVQDGVKEFELTTGVVRWSLLPDLEVGAYAYNGQVPGPMIRVLPGDRLRMRVRNELPEETRMFGEVPSWRASWLFRGGTAAGTLPMPEGLTSAHDAVGRSRWRGCAAERPKAAWSEPASGTAMTGTDTPAAARELYRVVAGPRPATL
jgi:FtsP/CotA-like multicopper oxidase with cupredoxin domain